MLPTSQVPPYGLFPQTAAGLNNSGQTPGRPTPSHPARSS